MTTTSCSVNQQQSMSRVAIVISMFVFILIGSVQALYGSALPAFTAKFSLSSSGGGILILAHWAGAFVGVILLVSNAIERRLKFRPMLACFLLGISSITLNLTDMAALAVGASFGVGLGFGWLTVGLNGIFARSFKKNKLVMVNALNAAFAIGAVLTPAIVVYSDTNPMNAFTVLGILMLTVALPALFIDDREQPAMTFKARPFARAYLSTHRLSLLFIMACVVAFETSLISWSVTILINLGSSLSEANIALSWFFAVFLFTRIIAVIASAFVSPLTIVVTTLVIAGMACSAISAFTSASTWFVVTGVVGALFPNVFAWVSTQFDSIPRFTPIVIAAAFLGATLGPASVGLILRVFSADALPFAISCIALVCLFALILTYKTSSSSIDEPTEVSR